MIKMATRALIPILGLALVAVLVAGCGTSSSTTSAAPTTTSAYSTGTSASSATTGASGGYTVMTSSNSALGTFLVDGEGRTLYHFSLDSNNTSKCTGSCVAKWPAFYAPTIVVPSDLNASDFTEFTRSDGTKQSQYKGQPLYYFFKDTAAGDVNGEGVDAFGGKWSVVPVQ